MKRLLLLRHAKSSWAVGGVSGADGQPIRDFDRPLNERGRLAAHAIGAYCAKNTVQPDMIFCSPAARTRETLSRIEASFSRRPPVIFKDVLYLASADRLLQEIASASDRDHVLMVIGHNSGLEDVAMFLSNPETSDHGALQTLMRKFPTGGLADFHLDIGNWSDIDRSTGALQRFITPKSLIAH
ncbi:MAG: histidine phosphatase family protein [Pseudomonadota bacterium]